MHIKACIISAFLTLWATQAYADAKLGEKAPNFSATILDGKQISLHNDYLGKKPIILKFWATWCITCKQDIPQLKKLYKHFGNRLPVLAINVGIHDSVDKARAYIKKYEIPYPVIFDQGSVITKAYRVMGTPTQIIIGANGTILYKGIHTPGITEIKAHWDVLTAK